MGREYCQSIQFDPDIVHSFDLPFGKAHVFFPVMDAAKFEISLLLESTFQKGDPDAAYLGHGHSIRRFVHTRKFSCSSWMSIAIEVAFAKMLANDPFKAMTAYPSLEISLASVQNIRSDAEIKKWFEPLGYQTEIRRQLGNQSSTDSANSQTFDIQLRCSHSLKDALDHLQVLLCALDVDHFHWIGLEESRKRYEMGAMWWGSHPAARAIQDAFETLPTFQERNQRMNLVEEHDDFSPVLPIRTTLDPDKEFAFAEIAQTIQTYNAKTILIPITNDIAFASMIASKPSVEKIIFIDLEIARLQLTVHLLKLAQIATEDKRKFAVFQASPLFSHDDLIGMDVVILDETFAKFPEHQWAALESAVFRHWAPKMIFVIQIFDSQMQAWAARVAKERNYLLSWASSSNPEIQTSMAIFERNVQG